MKTLYFKIITLVVVSLIALSCSNNGLNFSKKQYINKFEKFLSVTEEQCMLYDNDTWEKVNVQFEKYSNSEYDKFKPALTADEQIQIDKLRGRYYSCVTKM
jgi:hypothetical protein